MDFSWLTDIGNVTGSIITIGTLITIIVKPMRNAIIKWINVKTGKEEMLKKLNDLSVLVESSIAQNNKAQEELEKQSKALQASLRNSILNLYNKCIANSYITSFELQNLSSMYENYIALDGNSFVSECVDRLKALDIKNE